MWQALLKSRLVTFSINFFSKNWLLKAKLLFISLRGWVYLCPFLLLLLLLSLALFLQKAVTVQWWCFSLCSYLRQAQHRDGNFVTFWQQWDCIQQSELEEIQFCGISPYSSPQIYPRSKQMCFKEFDSFSSLRSLHTHSGARTKRLHSVSMCGWVSRGDSVSGVLSCSSWEAAQEHCTSLPGPTHLQCTHSALNVCVNYRGAGPVLSVLCEQTG